MAKRNHSMRPLRGLAERLDSFDKMKDITGGGTRHKASDKIICRGPDAYATMHRPGSNKKR